MTPGLVAAVDDLIDDRLLVRRQPGPTQVEASGQPTEAAKFTLGGPPLWDRLTRSDPSARSPTTQLEPFPASRLTTSRNIADQKDRTHGTVSSTY